MGTIQIKLNPKRGEKTPPGIAWFDEEDRAAVGKRKWFLGTAGVFTRQNPDGTPSKKSILLHRAVAGILDEPSLVIRFKNGNIKDCTRSNLMVMSREKLAEMIIEERGDDAPESLKRFTAKLRAGRPVQGEGHAPKGVVVPSIQDFFRECTFPDIRSYLWDRDLLQVYEEWQSEMGLASVPTHQSLEELRETLPTFDYVKRGMSSSKGVRWNGIGICLPMDKANENPKDEVPLFPNDVEQERTVKEQEGTATQAGKPHPLDVKVLEIQQIQGVIISLFPLSEMEGGKDAIERILKYTADHYGIKLEMRVGIFGQEI